MKFKLWIAIIVTLVTVGILAAVTLSPPCIDRPQIAKGQVSYASFRQADGKTCGWTSIDDSKAVPGGNGSWNEHRYAELDERFLVVTKPSEKGWGTLIIPTSQLLELHFASQ